MPPPIPPPPPPSNPHHNSRGPIPAMPMPRAAPAYGIPSANPPFAPSNYPPGVPPPPPAPGWAQGKARSMSDMSSSRSGGRRRRDNKRDRKNSRYFGDGDQDSGMGSSDSDTYDDFREASRSKSRSRRDRDRSRRRSIGSSSRSASTASSRYGSSRRASTKMAVNRRDHSKSRRRDSDSDSDSDTYVDDKKVSRSKFRYRRDRDRSSRRSIESSLRSASTASSRSTSRSGSIRRASTKMAVRRRDRSSKRHRDDSPSDSSDESNDRSYSSGGSSRTSLSSRANSMSSRSRGSRVSAYTYKDPSGRKKSRARYDDSDSDGPASIATTRPGRDRKRYKENSGLAQVANQVGFSARRNETYTSALAQVLANAPSAPWHVVNHEKTRNCPSRCVGCAMRALAEARGSRNGQRSFSPFESWAHGQDASDPMQLLKRLLRNLEKGLLGEVADPYLFQTGVACIEGHGAVESRAPRQFYPIKVSTRGLKSLDGALRKFAKGPVPKDWDFVQCQDRDCRSRSHKDRTSKTSRGEPYYSPRIFQGPEQLVIVLDRYGKSDRSKDKSVIKCPPLLSIDPVVPKSKRRSEDDTDYDLNAVICDLGRSPGKGPYVTYIRTSSEGWVKYDERGSPPKRVSAGYAHENRDAYMLFYTKSVSSQPKSQTWNFVNTGNGFKWDRDRKPPPVFNALFGFPFG